MSELLELRPGRENKGRGRLGSGGEEGGSKALVFVYPFELEEEW
jgi:hypothetical protein